MSEFNWKEFENTNFSEVERFFRDSNIKPIYDTRSDYTTNAPSFYEYLAKNNHLIKILAKRIYDYDKELAKRFEEWGNEVEKWNNEIDKRMSDWDTKIENLPDELQRMFLEWVDDGTLARILAQLMLDEYATKEQLTKTNQERRLESPISRKQYNMTNDGNDKTLIISWVDDDGSANVYNKWKPILKKYKIPLTSAVITDRLLNSQTGYYMTVEQTDELHELGMEFISHGHYDTSTGHPSLSASTDEQLEEQFRESTRVLKDLGYNYRTISLPGAANNYSIQRIGRKYFDYMIGTSSDPNRQEVFYPASMSNYYIRRIRTEYGIQHVKDKIDEAKQQGKAWVVLGSHLYEEIYTQAFIEEIIEYAINNGFKWVTTEEGIETMGNIAQFGTPSARSHAFAYSGTIIGADGTINSDEIGKVRHVGFREVKSDTPITYFPIDVISLTRLRTADAEGFPENRPGVLTTYRFSSGEGNSYQVYTTSGFKMYFERSWEDSTGTWSDWKRFNYEQFLPKDSIVAEDRAIGEKLRYKITHSIVSSGQTGFPDEKAGTLITYALSWDKFPYQEFYVYQEAKVYKRLWNGDDWSPWYLVQDRVLGTRVFPNTITGTTPASEISEGITMSYITSAESSEGLPIGASTGNLISYIEGNTGRNYQEFRGYASFDKFIRFERTSGEWSEWKKILIGDVE